MACIIPLDTTTLEIQSEVRAAVQVVGHLHMGDIERGVLGWLEPPSRCDSEHLGSRNLQQRRSLSVGL